jgi:hypothetical protein
MCEVFIRVCNTLSLVENLSVVQVCISKFQMLLYAILFCIANVCSFYRLESSLSGSYEVHCVMCCSKKDVSERHCFHLQGQIVVETKK